MAVRWASIRQAGESRTMAHGGKNMEHKQLVALVAAILAKSAEKPDLEIAAKQAEDLVQLVNSGRHAEPITRNPFRGTV